MRKIFSAMLVSLAMMLTVCKGPEEEQVGTARSEVAPVVESAGKGKPAGKKHPTKAWILACRVHGWGFGCFPGDSAFVTRTGMACEALDEMGELESLPGKEELVAWLKSRQQPDGGFLEAGDYYKNKLLPWGSMSALEPTYWAVKTLRLLGAEPERPQDAARFVKARQMPGGAFDSYEIGWNRVRTSEMLYSTFWGVGALKELGVPVPDSARIVEWIRSKQDTSTDMGGFNLGDKILAYYTAQGTYYAVRTLALLGAEPGRSAAAVKRFLLSDRGQEADGGFEMGHGDDWNNYDHYSRMVDTYAAVCALALLGTPLSDSDSSRAARPATACAAWIVSVQNPDGGFARLGITDQTPLRTPSEMRATWQAVKSLGFLECDVPSPVYLAEPVNEVRPHTPRYRYPAIHNDDPAEVWAYRRIALPIYEHFLAETGSRLEALGWLNRWARAAIGPMNSAFCTGGRCLLMHGVGQCAQMSLMMQQLASSVDHAARYSFVTGDVTCEILVKEDGWDQPHWCLFIPFCNEYPDPAQKTPDGRLNGWSTLDCTMDYRNRRRSNNYVSRTKLGDYCFVRARIETIDFEKGAWGRKYVIDTLTAYDSPVVSKLYPEGNW